MTTVKQCEILEKIFKSIPPQLEAAKMLENSEFNFINVSKNSPANKNIEPQRFSKKRKIAKNNDTSTQDDTDNIILNIIHDKEKSSNNLPK